MDTHEPVCVIKTQLSCVWVYSLTHSGYIYRVCLLTPSVMNVIDNGVVLPHPLQHWKVLSLLFGLASAKDSHLRQDQVLFSG